MNDIEYIIFDDNHRAIMENGVSLLAHLFASHALKMNDAIGKRWLAVVIAHTVRRKWVCRLCVSVYFSLFRPSQFSLIQKTNARKYF